MSMFSDLFKCNCTKKKRGGFVIDKSKSSSNKSRTTSKSNSKKTKSKKSSSKSKRAYKSSSRKTIF